MTVPGAARRGAREPGVARPADERPGDPAPGSVPAGPVTAVVPLRDGSSGKSRLAASLDAGARRRLVVVLARHVLGVLAASESVARVVVVTADVDFAREVLAGVPDLIGSSRSDRQFELPIRTRTADVIAEPPGRPGLNGALEHARQHVPTDSAGAADGADGATRAGAHRLLVVHADLPLLTPQDVAAVIDARADVVIATDRHGTGTNLLAVPLPSPSCQNENPVYPHHTLTTRGGTAFRFRFGAGSRATHEAEASRLDLSSAVVHRPGTAADLDTMDDVTDLPETVRHRLLSRVVRT